MLEIIAVSWQGWLGSKIVIGFGTGMSEPFEMILLASISLQPSSQCKLFYRRMSQRSRRASCAASPCRYSIVSPEFRLRSINASHTVSLQWE